MLESLQGHKGFLNPNSRPKPVALNCRNRKLHVLNPSVIQQEALDLEQRRTVYQPEVQQQLLLVFLLDMLGDGTREGGRERGREG